MQNNSRYFLAGVVMGVAIVLGTQFIVSLGLSSRLEAGASFVYWIAVATIFYYTLPLLETRE